MTAKLEILSGALEGRSYAVDSDEFVIGRAHSCQIVIPKRYVSRQHARICREGSDYIVDGLSKTNPVRIGNRAITEHLLSDGDVFEFCGIKVRFRLPQGGGRSKPTRKAKPRPRPSRRPDPAEDSWGDDPAEDSWREDPAGDSWRDDEPKGSNDSWRDAEPQEDSWAAADPDPADDSWRAPEHSAGVDRGSEDSWGTPAAKDDEWDDEESEESSEERRPARPARGSVVFEVDDEDSSEGTGELSLDDLRKRSSRGSGSGLHGESSNERTAELDAAPKDLDDPDYDPFAEVEASKKKGREVDPAKEKAIKALSLMGLLGIALAGVIYHQAVEVKDWTQLPVTPQTTISVAVGQTIQFEEPWGKADPPDGLRFTALDGSPYKILSDHPNAEVEWAVPDVPRRAILLVTGLEEGSAQFTIRYQNSRTIKTFEVNVEGDDPHELAHDKYATELRARPQRKLQEIMQVHKESGDQFKSRRGAAGRESYYRNALREYGKAADAARALRAKGGRVSDEVLRELEDDEQTARQEWESFVDREFARYRDLVARGESSERRVAQLGKVLRGISHECDVRYKRLVLILRESYSERLKSTGDEKCAQRP